MKKTSLTLSGLTLYANQNALTLRIGARGKATPAPDVYRTLPKGERRRLRKDLRRVGLASLAAL